MPMPKKQLPCRKNLKGWLITAIALACVFALCLAGAVWVHGKTQVFTDVEIGSGYKNCKIAKAEDSGIIVLGTYENVVQAFDKDENLLWKFDMSGATNSMCMDEELNVVIVGSQDRNIYILDIETGETVRILPFNAKVNDMDYDPQSKTLLVCGSVSASKASLATYNVVSGEELMRYQLKSMLNTVRFTADYSHIICGNTRAQLYVVDFENNELYLERLKDEIIEIDVAHDTNEVVAITKGGYYYRFNNKNETNGLENTQYQRLVGEGKSIGVNDDGKWCSVGMREGDVYILDAQGNQHYYQRVNDQVRQIYIGEDESYVVTLSDKLYRFDTGVLQNMKLFQSIDGVSTYIVAALGVIMLAAFVCAFGKSRSVAAAFFRALHKHRTAYIMLIPTFALVLLFNYYPVLQAFYYAFTDWSSASLTMRDVKFVGFDNFVKMVENGYFLIGLKNMVIIMLTSFVKLLTVPVILALLVYAMKSDRQKYWYRLLLIAPMVVPGVVSVLMWKNIYDPNIGALNALLKAIGREEWCQSWLGKRETALASIIFMGFPWVNGMAFLVFYGGLIDIPADLFEAAKVDGSTPHWDLWHIKIPLITPQLKMMVILTFISSIQDYGGVLLLTGGGPGTTTYVPGLELYFNATTFGQYGYACALGLVMFVFILGGTIVNLKMKTQELG